MKTVKVTKGNDFCLYIPLVVLNASGAVPVQTSDLSGISVTYKTGCGVAASVVPTYVENYMVLTFPDTLAVGVYSLDITGTYSQRDIRKHINECFAVVEWDSQSNWRDYLVGDHVVTDTQAFIGVLYTNAEYQAKIAELNTKIAQAEAAKAAYDAKVAMLDGVAQQTTLTAVKSETDKIGSASDGSAVSSLFGKIASVLSGIAGLFTRIGTASAGRPQTVFGAIEGITAIDQAYSEGKDALADAITAKGVETQATDSLSEMADNVEQISQEEYTLQGSELYEKQLFGAETNTSVSYEQPNSPLWNLYAIMANLKSDGRFINYGGILLAEYFKGYDTIDLMNAGAGGAYFTCDGDFYTTDRAGNNAHVWHDGDDGKMNRWVAYLFASDYSNYQIPITDLCPRSIHIGRKVGNIICGFAGRIREIVVTDGNELIGTNFSSTQVWGQEVVIRNIQIADNLLNTSSNIVSAIIGAKTFNYTAIGNNTSLVSLDISKAETFGYYIYSNTNSFFGNNISMPLNYLRFKDGTEINGAIFASTAFSANYWGSGELVVIGLKSFRLLVNAVYGPRFLYSKMSFPDTEVASSLFMGARSYEQPNLKILYFPKCKVFGLGISQILPVLEDIEVGELNANCNCRIWNPTSVIADADKLATLNANIRNHIAAKVSDRTGMTSLTFTVSTNLYNNLEQATIDAFTAKNWLVAGA